VTCRLHRQERDPQDVPEQPDHAGHEEGKGTLSVGRAVTATMIRIFFDPDQSSHSLNWQKDPA
jgi:hypothetical protein